MTNETTKPVVTQADFEMARSMLEDNQTACSCSDCRNVLAHNLAKHRLASQAVVSQADRFKAKPQPDIDRDAVSERMFDEFKQTFDGLAHSSQAVVSQDLVEQLNDQYRLSTSLMYPASAIEAAQIAARNDALEEAETALANCRDLSGETFGHVARIFRALKRGDHRA